MYIPVKTNFKEPSVKYTTFLLTKKNECFFVTQIYKMFMALQFVFVWNYYNFVWLYLGGVIVASALLQGVPIPSLTSALCYFDGYSCERLPASLLQAQRDYFGAHTYERIDQPCGKFFHTNWTGRGGDTASTTYTV